MFSLVVGLGFLSLEPLFGYAAFQEPTASAPQYDPALITDFINGSVSTQQKIGTLRIGDRNGAIPHCTTNDSSGCSSLCLNPAVNSIQVPVATDPVNCVTSWTGLINSLVSTSNFVRKLTNPTHVDAPSSPDTIDNGAFNLQAAAYDPNYPTSAQLISLIATAPSAAAAPRSAALWAASDVDANYAAQFDGKVAVVGSVPDVHRVCLNFDPNDTNGINETTNCITTWSDLVVRLAAVQLLTVVRLQKFDYPESIIPDVGSVSFNEFLQTGSIIAGAPISLTPISASCGDGLCSPENGETAAPGPNQCLIDCTP